MALTKTIENDKIEVTYKYNVHVRTATIIKEDGKELNRSFSRKVLVPGKLDASDNLVETNISGEDADVQAICNAAWTTANKEEFRLKLVAEKETGSS